MRPSKEEEEHVSLCGLHQCFASHDNSRYLTVKQSYSNAPSTICGAGKSAVSLPLACKPPHGKGGRRRRASSYSGEAYSAVSYNDVLSTGIGVVGTEDCKREPRAAYRTANAQASRGAKQEPAEPAEPNGGGGGGGGGGDSKDGDSKQKSGGQDSSGGHGAAGEKSDDGSDNEDDTGSEDSGSSEEEDDGVVRCVCGERNDGELMIQCEICQVWQHTLCMGIRDEAHIPDKYYCEKCHPSDHPYINSRPRTMVLAEATALGASTMMRRSAVMAVAKMTAREEYRSASAAAAIAASVAAAATSSSASAGAGGHGRKRAPAAPGRRGVSGGADAAQKPPRRTPRRKQQPPPPQLPRGGAESTGADGSEDDYAERGLSETPGAGGSGASVERADGAELADRGALKGVRKAQTPKRAAAQSSSGGGGGGGGGKRRRVDRPASPGAALPGEEDAFAEGLVARMLGAATPASRAQQRNRSTSTVAGSAALHADGQRRRRGRSAPGSPTQPSPSPSPPLLPLLPLPAYAADCGESSAGADDADDSAAGGGGGERQMARAAKRRRVGALGRGGGSSKHLRMAASAANSPSMGDAAGDQILDLLRASAGDGEAEKQAAEDGVENGMLNALGQPMYSSAAADTMCRIRYPHGRASLYELSRRAKQLLEWLGKAQSEYEHERLSWLPPLLLRPEEQSGVAVLVRASSLQLSDAPTSPISPSDWPATTADEHYHDLAADADANANDNAHHQAEAGDQSRPRSTLSMMEDLMWRLIRFQETYSN
ncbi:Histone deacetylase complex subunit [Coemansia sp. RSA 2424]|nr:Histone deacetylase complex subunit [Coemansia sp. RSA 2424]